MRTTGSGSMGRVTIDVEFANNDDLALMHRGLLEPD
jgi:hypothetical protein